MNDDSRADRRGCKGESCRLSTHWTRDSLRRLLQPLLILLPLSVCGIGEQPLVEFAPADAGFHLVSDGAAAVIQVNESDWPGALRAATDLQSDIARVTGITPALSHGEVVTGVNVVVVGTIGKSRLVDQLVREHKIDISSVTGKWESTLIQTVKEPMPGVKTALVIAGSDKRGTIYGIYTLSEQIGVSPWYWWADVPVRRHDALYVRPGRHTLGPPAVKYRGIFLNDEAPALAGWAREKFGGFNHRFYTNVFELLLRLKANYLWPAMWDNSFATDDPLNAKLADEYGIVVGTSHHEPMMRAWKEWERTGNRKGSWDYSKNAAKLRDYWAEGLRRTKDYEKVITLGMRGDGDEPMTETESVALLERIVADQRKLIGEIIDPRVEQVPQSWALYKEVQGYYERGMRVPDDVTLLWCDDNWGNLRHLPTAAERRRSGGAGIYYHLDYVGGPRNYKWLNTVPLPKIWEQMNLALHHGADRLWVVNVGDLKPLEVPMEFFLTFARDPARWTQDRLQEYLQLWAEREFGTAYAKDIADIVAKYAKYNGRRKPELLAPETFSLENYGEADRIIAEWHTISGQAEAIRSRLPREKQDAFFELVLYPTRACAVVNELYVDVGKNHLYARRGELRANEYAEAARKLFREDAELCGFYNRQLAGGKWNHMMDQTHIGYTGWQQPPANTLPALMTVDAGSQTNPPAEPTRSTQTAGSLPPPADWRGFLERDGYVAMEAEHFSTNVPNDSARWVVLPDHGRTLSGMTPFPVDAPSQLSGPGAPRLEYRVWLTTTGALEVTLYLSPSLNYDPDRGVRIGTSLDAATPQILTVVPPGYNAGDGNRDWEESVKNGIRAVKSKFTTLAAGAHTLKVWMVDPGVVLQRIIVNTGGERPSYLGPPESARLVQNR